MGIWKSWLVSGLDVDLNVSDITEYVLAGEENIIDYNACRVSGNSCVTPQVVGLVDIAQRLHFHLI